MSASKTVLQTWKGRTAAVASAFSAVPLCGLYIGAAAGVDVFTADLLQTATLIFGPTVPAVWTAAIGAHWHVGQTHARGKAPASLRPSIGAPSNPPQPQPGPAEK